MAPNAISRQLQALREQGIPVLDLTESNPTKVGIRYPEGLLSPLSDPRSLLYEPSAQGLRSAREAVASLCASHEIRPNPDQVLLTASTSEAYSHLFRLLADPGDSVLVPAPSYPLFEYLADLNDVEPVRYPLRYEEGWRIDLEALKRLVGKGTKAVVLIHPNNPTGSCVTSQELAGIVRICRQDRLALISDEVFAPYLYNESHRSLAGDPEILTFTLGGISKSLGLPQMKLAWMVVTGPADLVQPALARLELILDTYLSVATPVQGALPRWLEFAPAIQSQIRQRLIRNRRVLTDRLRGVEAVCLQADGGWNGVLRAPGIQDEEEWVLRLLEEERLLVHPGYFFDFEEPGHLVVSLLPPPEMFEEALTRLLKRF